MRRRAKPEIMLLSGSGDWKLPLLSDASTYIGRTNGRVFDGGMWNNESTVASLLCTPSLFVLSRTPLRPAFNSYNAVNDPLMTRHSTASFVILFVEIYTALPVLMVPRMMASGYVRTSPLLMLVMLIFGTAGAMATACRDEEM